MKRLILILILIMVPFVMAENKVITIPYFVDKIDNDTMKIGIEGATTIEFDPTTDYHQHGNLSLTQSLDCEQKATQFSDLVNIFTNFTLGQQIQNENYKNCPEIKAGYQTALDNSAIARNETEYLKKQLIEKDQSYDELQSRYNNCIGNTCSGMVKEQAYLDMKNERYVWLVIGAVLGALIIWVTKFKVSVKKAPGDYAPQLGR